MAAERTRASSSRRSYGSIAMCRPTISNLTVLDPSSHSSLPSLLLHRLHSLTLLASNLQALFPDSPQSKDQSAPMTVLLVHFDCPRSAAPSIPHLRHCGWWIRQTEAMLVICCSTRRLGRQAVRMDSLASLPHQLASRSSHILYPSSHSIPSPLILHTTHPVVAQCQSVCSLSHLLLQPLQSAHEQLNLALQWSPSW